MFLSRITPQHPLFTSPLDFTVALLLLDARFDLINGIWSISPVDSFECLRCQQRPGCFSTLVAVAKLPLQIPKHSLAMKRELIFPLSCYLMLAFSFLFFCTAFTSTESLFIISLVFLKISWNGIYGKITFHQLRAKCFQIQMQLTRIYALWKMWLFSSLRNVY